MRAAAGHYDVIVIGAGAAGMMAALHTGTPATALVTNGPIGRSNTIMAQGGVQLPHDTEASKRSLVADMMASARVPVDEARVERFVAEIIPTFAELAAMGLELDRDGDGRIIRRLAGGLSEPRIASGGDHIGRDLVRVLGDAIGRSDIEVVPNTHVVGIEPGAGAITVSCNDATRFTASAVVVATGGTTAHRAAAMHERSTNPANSNHEMVDLLLNLGLPQIHEDFYQYQPFGLVDLTGSFGKCVPESVVNFPVRLLDAAGKELCPVRQDRYALTQAMFEGRRAGRASVRPNGPGFLLTLSDIPGDEMERTFPKLHAALRRTGLDGHDVWVWPYLHYQLGGFAVGRDGMSEVPGLYLAGEMVGGLHGRNRLMGNGITDSLVNGRLAGAAAGAFARSHRR